MFTLKVPGRSIIIAAWIILEMHFSSTFPSSEKHSPNTTQSSRNLSHCCACTPCSVQPAVRASSLGWVSTLRRGEIQCDYSIREVNVKEKHMLFFSFGERRSASPLDGSSYAPTWLLNKPNDPYYRPPSSSNQSRSWQQQWVNVCSLVLGLLDPCLITASKAHAEWTNVTFGVLRHEPCGPASRILSRTDSLQSG